MAPPWRRWCIELYYFDFDTRAVVVSKIAGDVFREYRDTLATAITPDDIPHLVNSLYSKNIISQDNLDRAMMIGILPSEKKVHLLDAIEARIRSRPSAFYTVLDILDSEPVFSEHAESLWEKYWEQVEQEWRAKLNKFLDGRGRPAVVFRSTEKVRILTVAAKKTGRSTSIQELIKLLNVILDVEDAKESAEKDDEKDHDQESADPPESKKKSLLSHMRKGVRKMFGAARDMTSSFIKEALSALNLDVKISRMYKKRFDKHTKREQVRWWFEIWGDEGALKALESKWEAVSSQNKWRLETCPVPPPQRC